MVSEDCFFVNLLLALTSSMIWDFVRVMGCAPVGNMNFIMHYKTQVFWCQRMINDVKLLAWVYFVKELRRLWKMEDILDWQLIHQS